MHALLVETFIILLALLSGTRLVLREYFTLRDEYCRETKRPDCGGRSFYDQQKLPQALHVLVPHDIADRDPLVSALQGELRRHSFEDFIVHSSGRGQEQWGLVIRGCPACGTELRTIDEFMEHLVQDVIPPFARNR